MKATWSRWLTPVGETQNRSQNGSILLTEPKMTQPKMTQLIHVSPRWRKPAAVPIFVFLLLVYLSPEKVLAQVDSHERDTEPKISLSAGAIIEILRREPGLLLEVKRSLVRKAYEQGRLLGPRHPS